MRWSNRIESWWRDLPRSPRTGDGPRGAEPSPTPAPDTEPPGDPTPPWPAREPEATPRAAALARAHHLRAALDAIDHRLERWTDAAGVAQTRASRFAALAQNVGDSRAFDPLRDALCAWAAGAAAPEPRADANGPAPAAIAAASHWLAEAGDAPLPGAANPIARVAAHTWLRHHPDVAADAGWTRGWTPNPLRGRDAEAFAVWLAHGASGPAPTDARSLLLRLATAWLEAALPLAHGPRDPHPVTDAGDAIQAASETLAWLAEGSDRPPPPAARAWLERSAMQAWLASEGTSSLPRPLVVRLRPLIANAVGAAGQAAPGRPQEVEPTLNAPADIPAWLDAVEAATTVWRPDADAPVTRPQATAAARLWTLLEAPARAAERAFFDARVAATLRDDLAVLRGNLRAADPAAVGSVAPYRLTLDALAPPPPGAPALPPLGPAWMPDLSGRGRSRVLGRRIPSDPVAVACPLEPARCLCHAAGVIPCPVVRALAATSDPEHAPEADD